MHIAPVAHTPVAAVSPQLTAANVSGRRPEGDPPATVMVGPAAPRSTTAMPRPKRPSRGAVNIKG